MAHNYGNEYRIRIIQENGTEELSEWMNSTEQVAQALIVAHTLRRKTCWLQVRNIFRPSSLEMGPVSEYPIMDIPSPRCISPDPHHQQAANSNSSYSIEY